jgi:hypothetical protein
MTDNRYEVLNMAAFVVWTPTDMDSFILNARHVKKMRLALLQTKNKPSPSAYKKHSSTTTSC